MGYFDRFWPGISICGVWEWSKNVIWNRTIKFPVPICHIVDSRSISAYFWTLLEFGIFYLCTRKCEQIDQAESPSLPNTLRSDSCTARRMSRRGSVHAAAKLSAPEYG